MLITAIHAVLSEACNMKNIIALTAGGGNRDQLS